MTISYHCNETVHSCLLYILSLDMCRSCLETNYSLFPQLGVSTVCKRLSEAVFSHECGGVCMCDLHTHAAACMGMATRSACAPLRKRGGSEGEGKGREESRSADALLGIRLCCHLSEKKVRRRRGERHMVREGITWDEQGWPDVSPPLTVGEAQSCHIRAGAAPGIGDIGGCLGRKMPICSDGFEICSIFSNKFQFPHL